MDSSQSFWFLENIDVSGILCPQKVSGVSDGHTHRSYQKGEYIYLPEEDANKIFFITEGRVKIGSYAENGKEVTKVLLNTGEVFGEMALANEEKRRDFAQALESTAVCIIEKEYLKGLMRNHSGLRLFLMKILGSRMYEMEQRLESLVFKDSRTRVIEFLYQLAQKKGQRVGYEMLVRNFMTHQDIANLTATSRQTVTTVLNDLRNKNLLTFNRRRLLVRDMEKLGIEAGF